MSAGEAALGLDDEALATTETRFSADAYAGQVALVSGGSGGIGRGIAWLFARLGAHVVVTGRNETKLVALVEAMAARGLRANYEVVDIRKPDEVSGLIDRVWARFGRLDLLVNSAGGQFPQAAIDFSINGWNAVIDTNLNGTWHMMQASARRWRDTKRPGSIINIIVVTTHGLHGVAHTIAARSGVIGLSRAIAVEWAPLGYG